jgi:hypothetical protein
MKGKEMVGIFLLSISGTELLGLYPKLSWN